MQKNGLKPNVYMYNSMLKGTQDKSSCLLSLSLSMLTVNNA